MTKSAVVTKILNDRYAEIAVKRESVCGSCASCGASCDFRQLITVTALNKAEASFGDEVTVSSRTSGIIGATALVYLLPLVFFLLGYSLSAALRLSEVADIAISIGAFFVGTAVVLVVGRTRKKREVYEIVEILKVE